MSYLKPQSPIEINSNYIYPLTTWDQIINEDGSRGYDISNKIPFLYRALLKLDSWEGEFPYSQTVELVPIFSNSKITSSSIICSPAMCNQTDSEETNYILKNTLSIINGGNIKLQNGNIVITVFEKPNTDIEIYLLIATGGN